MTGKDKFIYILLCIITFGIYPMMIKKGTKTTPTNEIRVEEKTTINLIKLYEALGGKDNLAGNEYTYTKVKIFLNDRSKADVEKVKSIKGISGVVAGSKYITVIVGKQAKALSNEL